MLGAAIKIYKITLTLFGDCTERGLGIKYADVKKVHGVKSVFQLSVRANGIPRNRLSVHSDTVNAKNAFDDRGIDIHVIPLKF